MAQILRSQAARYVQQHAAHGACFQVQSVLAKLSLCRTRALGGTTYQCADCGEVSEVYHSCGDRHCPQCSGCKRYDFASRAEQLILPGVVYYQVVFTLPGELSELALANREAMAKLLFQSARKSLRQTVRRQQGYDPASMMVLHSWNQQLEPHWHVHALVPGGGPSLTGDRWQTAQAPAEVANHDGYYLVDAISLREAFRKFAIAHLRRLYAAGELKLAGKFADWQDEPAWQSFCDGLAAKDWVSFIQPPPTASSTADQVVRYLTRYLTGGPISEGRIIAADTEQVTFWARTGERVGGEREQVPVTLEAPEFVRRWCDHIQPEQLTKTRYFGGWCCRQRAAYQARCRVLLGQPPAFAEALPEVPSNPSAANIESLAAGTIEELSAVQCQSCASRRLQRIAQTAKPSWSELLTHLDDRCPSWYAEREYESFRAYLEREYGIGYEDWYQELRIESTMRAGLSAAVSGPRESVQMYLPGLCPERDLALESY